MNRIFKTGKVEQYYYTFYGFLFPFAHSNFGVVNYYLDEHFRFTVEKVNYPILDRDFTLFVFTMIFEHIVLLRVKVFLTREQRKNAITKGMLILRI